MMVSSGNTRPWNQWIVQFGIKKGHYKNLGWSISQNSYQMQMSIMQGLEEGFQGFQNIRVIDGPPKWYQVMRSPKLVPNNQNTPYLRSYGHFQMTLFDQRVNIKIIFSFYSIYITYSFRSEDLTPGWLLCQEIQGPKIIDVNNQMVLIGGQMAIFKWPYLTKRSILQLYFLFTASI